MSDSLIILLVVVVVTSIFWASDNSFIEKCRLRGGTPDTQSFNQVCYAPGVVIDVN